MPDVPLQLACSMIDAFGKACAEIGARLEMEEVCILWNADMDLSSDDVQLLFRQAVLSGKYDAGPVTPPCGSFSRLQWANRRGPCPVQSQQWPRGFPWLFGASKRRARRGNELVDFSLQLAMGVAQVNAQSKHHVLIMGEHPEDLG